MAASILRARNSQRRILNICYQYQYKSFSVIQSRATATPTINTNVNTNIEPLQESSNNRLSIGELNDMVIDPEKYDAIKLAPHFRRIPREGLVMHSFVLSWYSFTAFALLLYVGTAAISYYDVYVTKESVEPKDKSWAKDMNVFQRMWYDYTKKKEKGEENVFK
mmetsp:Transcript_45602/g.40855  ORF Transcript_45602/g.40855 Transcript_45602/m.40855 type:complete len:164 (-) Transcript_45602:9-500(-)